jgi:hypothetical protein
MDIVERLRICAAYDPDQKEAADEIERLRKALREIHGLGDTPDDSWKAYQICCKALGEKE